MIENKGGVKTNKQKNKQNVLALYQLGQSQKTLKIELRRKSGFCSARNEAGIVENVSSFFFTSAWIACLILSEATAVFRLVDLLMVWQRHVRNQLEELSEAENIASSAVMCYEAGWEAHVNLFHHMIEALVSHDWYPSLVTLIRESKDRQQT